MLAQQHYITQYAPPGTQRNTELALTRLQMTSRAPPAGLGPEVTARPSSTAWLVPGSASHQEAGHTPKDCQE